MEHQNSGQERCCHCHAVWHSSVTSSRVPQRHSAGHKIPVYNMCCGTQEVQEKSSTQASSSQRSKGPSFRADPKVIKRLHRLEKHMRENKLRHTFADQLGEAQESDELNSKKEARKLAFYLFWNVRPDYDRCCTTPLDPLPRMAICLPPCCSSSSVLANLNHPCLCVCMVCMLHNAVALRKRPKASKFNLWRVCMVGVSPSETHHLQVLPRLLHSACLSEHVGPATVAVYVHNVHPGAGTSLYLWTWSFSCRQKRSHML